MTHNRKASRQSSTAGLGWSGAQENVTTMRPTLLQLFTKFVQERAPGNGQHCGNSFKLQERAHQCSPRWNVHLQKVLPIVPCKICRKVSRVLTYSTKTAKS